MLLKGQLMADASVQLVMVSGGRVLRRVPDQLESLMNRLRRGPDGTDD